MGHDQSKGSGGSSVRINVLRLDIRQEMSRFGKQNQQIIPCTPTLIVAAKFSGSIEVKIVDRSIVVNDS